MDAKSLEAIGNAGVFRLQLKNRIAGLQALVDELSDSKLMELIDDGKGIFGIVGCLILSNRLEYEIKIEATVKHLACFHGVHFDYEAAKDLSSHEVRIRWPRLSGLCPLGCGYNGISYASAEHYTCGDW